MSNNRQMPISKARVNLGAVTQEVYTKGSIITLEKGGVPIASLVQVDMLEDLRDAIDMAAARIATTKDVLVPWDKIRTQYVQNSN